MADKKADERFVQSIEQMEITNIPPEVREFVRKQKEEKEKKKNEK